MLKLSSLGWVAFVLVIIGALNWGIVGIFNGFNFVSWIFGTMSVLSRIVYILVGISALYLLGELAATPRVSEREMHKPHPA
jgi:uncharacterized membrane protein YuzA (DUF378 family)